MIQPFCGLSEKIYRIDRKLCFVGEFEHDFLITLLLLFAAVENSPILLYLFVRHNFQSSVSNNL